MNGKDLKPEKARLPIEYLDRIKELGRTADINDALNYLLGIQEMYKPSKPRLVCVNGKRIG